jgi:hypothetical protein
MRRIRAACCARAASGHAAAALPTNVMNSRRCMCPPSSGDSILTSIGAEIDFKPLPQRKANVADGVRNGIRLRLGSLPLCPQRQTSDCSLWLAGALT